MIGYFYNKELFDQAGIQPATTWKEFFDNCDKLLAAGITPLAMDTADGAWVSMLLMGAMVATSGDEGLEFMNTKYPTDYNIEPVVNAVAEMQKWYQNYTTLDAVGGAYENAANNFFSGNVAMICNGPWMIGDFSDTSKTPEGFDQNVGVADLSRRTSSMTPPLRACSSPSRTILPWKRLAIAMVKFFTSPESQQLALEMQGMVPAAASVEITDTAPPIPAAGRVPEHGFRLHGAVQHLHRQHGPRPAGSFSAELPNLANGTYTPEQFCQILTDFATANAVT